MKDELVQGPSPEYLHAMQLHASDKPVLDNLSWEERSATLTTYLQTLLAAERQLIGRYYGGNEFNPYGFPGKMDMKTVYIVNRIPSVPILEIVNKLMPEKDMLNVLEIGGGDGSNIAATTQDLSQGGKEVHATMTALNRLPQHDEVEEKGISLVSDTLAEALPEEWTEQFDMVITICTLGWTNLHYSLQEIKRVLKPNGVWIGLESYGASRTSPDRDQIFNSRSINLSGSLRERVLNVMEENDMSIDPEVMNILQSRRTLDGNYPVFDVFGYIKH